MAIAIFCSLMEVIPHGLHVPLEDESSGQELRGNALRRVLRRLVLEADVVQLAAGISHPEHLKEMRAHRLSPQKNSSQSRPQLQ